MPWISAGASLLGGLFSSNSANSAAAAQTAATNRANELQKPAIDAGNIARNQLMRLLGLGGDVGGGQSYEQLRQTLLPQYQKGGQIMSPVMGEGNVPTGAWEYKDGGVDENGLNAAIQQRMSQSGGQSADYGSLLRNFTGADLQNEPGYQFGMNQGLMALDRKNAAGGGYFSGQALKAAQGFAQDYAGTKFNDAFNRDNTNKTRAYNQLSNLAGSGQMAVNNVGSNITGLGNAQGAANIASGNAISGGLTGAANNFQQYNMMNKLLDRAPNSGQIGFGNQGWGTGYGGTGYGFGPFNFEG